MDSRAGPSRSVCTTGSADATEPGDPEEDAAAVPATSDRAGETAQLSLHAFTDAGSDTDATTADCGMARVRADLAGRAGQVQLPGATADSVFPYQISEATSLRVTDVYTIGGGLDRLTTEYTAVWHQLEAALTAPTAADVFTTGPTPPPRIDSDAPTPNVSESPDAERSDGDEDAAWVRPTTLCQTVVGDALHEQADWQCWSRRTATQVREAAVTDETRAALSEPERAADWRPAQTAATVRHAPTGIIATVQCGGIEDCISECAARMPARAAQVEQSVPVGVVIVPSPRLAAVMPTATPGIHAVMDVWDDVRDAYQAPPPVPLVVVGVGFVRHAVDVETANPPRQAAQTTLEDDHSTGSSVDSA